MGMYCNLLIPAQDIINGEYSEFNLPTYILSDTEHIYNFIKELGLRDVMNHYQLELMDDWRQDIGSVPVPKYIYDLDDDAIHGLSLSIDIPLTSSDEIEEFIIFIRDHQIPALLFG